MRIQFVVMAVAATALIAAEGHAQYGTPLNLRVMTPTIRDADPGIAPGAESKLDPAYRHQMVLYNTSEAPGTIIVNTSERFLYLIQPNNRAWRYGIGVRRDGFQWQGLLKI